MADRKATNKYYPPEWTPDKGSINKFVGQHPLRDRARKLSQGILIVRFELPFNIWCEGCNNHVGTGVRYNAEKKKIGNYYSTPIFSFRMRCHLCSGWIEIHTDPKNAKYNVISGAKQKVETWEPEDNETIRLRDKDETQKMQDNKLFRLETIAQDKKKALQSASVINDLQSVNERQWKDVYEKSSLLRSRFRKDKKKDEAIKAGSLEIQERNSLSIPVLPETEEDIQTAKAISFTDTQAYQRAIKRKREIEKSSIFGETSSTISPAPSNLTKWVKLEITKQGSFKCKNNDNKKQEFSQETGPQNPSSPKGKSLVSLDYNDDSSESD